MAQIQSGATSDLMTVDPTSKAARVTQYDTSGNTVFYAAPVGAYLLPIQVRQTAATSAASTIWAMRNSTTISVYIKKIVVNTSFDGTPAASTGAYNFLRFNTATPTTGTALTVVKKSNSYGASNVTDARFLDTGLSVTSVVFETSFMQVGVARQNGSTQVMQSIFDLSGYRNQPFILAPSEGLCIQLNVTAVIGDSIAGYVEWDER